MADDPKLLRMVRYHFTQRVSEWCADPYSFPEDEMMPLALNFNGGRAIEVADVLLLEHFKRLPDEPDLVDLRKLFKFDLTLQQLAKSENKHATEIGLFAAAVPPDYGKLEWEYTDWARKVLPNILRGEGARVSMAAGTGAGKTHLFNLWGEWALEQGRVVMVNFKPCTDPRGTYGPDRLVYVRTLSDVWRVMAENPGKKFLLCVDEPESALRGSASLGVVNWSNFLHFIRKWRLDIVEIWHDRNEQYKAGREATGGKIWDLEKTDRDRFSLKGNDKTFHVTNVPALSFIEYDHRANGTFNADLDMGYFQHHLGDMESDGARRAKVLELLKDPRSYLKKWQDDVESEDSDPYDAAIVEVREDPAPFLNQKGNVDADLVYQRFKATGLTHRSASGLAKKINNERAGDEA